MIQLPPGSVARYRIMTEKSVIGFGKYADMTVGDVLVLAPGYVAWMYFAKEKISLCADIKQRLGLPDIEKPGINLAALEEWKKSWREHFTKEQQEHFRFVRQAKKKAAARRRLDRARRDEERSVANLQAINQGHSLAARRRG